MKKRGFRILGSGLTYGALIGMFLFLVNTPAKASFFETLKILLVAVICAVVSGLVLSLVLYGLELLRSNRFESFRQSLAKEVDILLEDGATRLFNKKHIKGWLFLTASTLIFKPYGEDGERVLPVEMISSVEITDPRRCQITVSTSSMEAETFSVSDPLAWFNKLGESEK